MRKASAFIAVTFFLPILARQQPAGCLLLLSRSSTLAMGLCLYALSWLAQKLYEAYDLWLQIIRKRANEGELPPEADYLASARQRAQEKQVLQEDAAPSV